MDYIASHLNEYGRAGIIVPEGIIFQKPERLQTAPPPAGRGEPGCWSYRCQPECSSPYSGVKTSILILDKVLAPKTDSVAFFKVENDGFDLGDPSADISTKMTYPTVYRRRSSEYLGRLRCGETTDDSRRLCACDGLAGSQGAKVSGWWRLHFKWRPLSGEYLQPPQLRMAAWCN